MAIIITVDQHGGAMHVAFALAVNPRAYGVETGLQLETRVSLLQRGLDLSHRGFNALLGVMASGDATDARTLARVAPMATAAGTRERNRRRVKAGMPLAAADLMFDIGCLQK